MNTLIHDYNQDAIDQVNKSANNTANFIDSRMQLIYRELSDEEVARLPGSAERYVQNWQRYQRELAAI